MEDVKIAINPTGFPNQFSSDSEKKSYEFGLQIGQAIQYEWFRQDGGQSRFYNQWADFHRLRLYARGEQSVQKYKNELAIDGDLSYLNLDWTPVPIIPKFVDIVVNGMADRLFKVNVYAQDGMSLDKRSKYQVQLEKDMLAKPVMKQVQEQTGINTFATSEEDIPNTSEELALHMQLKYKPSIEIAEEEAINTVLGEQSVQKYKNELAIDGDLSYLNLDWTPVPIIPKFVDIVVNGMADRLFKVNVYAQDGMSLDKRSKYQVQLEKDMLAKPVMKQVQEQTGINTFATSEEDIPNTSEELALHMQLKYKPSIEIAEEEAINTVLDENRYHDIQKQLYYDQTVLGISMCKNSFQPGAGIKIDYVDPANVVYSYTEDPNFKDCFIGEKLKHFLLQS